MRLEKYLINETKTTSTTILHEVGVALFSFDPKAKVSTMMDFVHEVSKYNIYPVNSSLTKLPFDNYLSVIDELTKKDLLTLDDARKIGTKIGKIFGKPSAVMWTGPTNDSSEFGSSDIVVIDKNRKKIPISLKKGKGQLKNMGVNVFSNIIFEGVFDEKNLLTLMFDGKYIRNWDSLTEIWLSVLSQEGLEKAGEYADMSKYNTWNNYQKTNIPEDDLDEFVREFNGKKLPSNKLKVVASKYYGNIYGENPGKGNGFWIDSRNKALELILTDIVKSHEQKIRENLKELFKVQMSSGQHPIWLVANSGKDIMYIPSNEDLELFADKLLKFDFDTDTSSSGYKFVLYVKKGETPIMDISIDVRWKQGQMNGKPSTASSKRMHISDKTWNDMFNRGNIWEGELVEDIINKWVLWG